MLVCYLCGGGPASCRKDRFHAVFLEFKVLLAVYSTVIDYVLIPAPQTEM
jgi:hypothetical protein